MFSKETQDIIGHCTAAWYDYIYLEARNTQGQFFPEGWENGCVYILTYAELGEASEKVPILASSPDYNWVNGKKKIYGKLFESILDGTSVSLKIFKMYGKTGDPYRVENLQEVAVNPWGELMSQAILQSEDQRGLNAMLGVDNV